MSSFSSASGRAGAEPSHPPSSSLNDQTVGSAGTRQPPIHWLTEAIVKHRRLLLAISVVPFLVSFNGRWRMGLDSSIYRGLARAIATGRGYQFGEFGTHQIYPGLPVLLAGMIRVFGENVYRPVASLILMVLMALLTLFLTYRLIARHYPKWIAVCVTCGMATNAWFLRLSQELLSDVPFLLGVMATLLGWDLLRTASRRNARIGAAALMIAGLSMSAVMRPTFWILVLALCCGWAISALRGFRNGQWKLPAAGVVMVASICAIFWAIDPRSSGLFHPLSGGYEAEMLETLQDSGTPQADSDPLSTPLKSRIPREITLLLTQHLPAAFLGQQLPSIGGLIFSIILIGSTLFMVVKQPTWTLMVFFTLGITVMLSTEPRYYVMILPFLLLGSLLLLKWLGSLLWGGWGDLVVLAGLGMVTGMNFAKAAPFVAEQHSIAMDHAYHFARFSITTDESFYDHYRDGKFAPVIHLSDLVARNVAPGAKVIAPSAQVVAYLSDRTVLMERELLKTQKSARHYPERLASLGISYAVFPGKFYRDKEPMLARLIDRHVIQSTERIGSTDGMHLAKAQIALADDWLKNPVPLLATASPTTKKSHATSRPTSKPTTTRLHAAAMKRAAAKAAAAKRRKHAAATQSTTGQTTTAPSSNKKKKKKHPTTTTAPTTQPTTQPTGA